MSAGSPRSRLPVVVRIFLAAAIACAASAFGAVASEFRVPQPKFRTLDNGLKVAVFPDSRLGIVQIELLIPAGAAAEPPDQSGVARLTAGLLKRGTSSRSADAFGDDLDRLGGGLDVGATQDYVIVDGAFLAADFESGLELVSDAVVNPIFPESELAQIKARTLLGLAASRRDPASLADQELWAAVFGGHPYGRTPLRTAASLMARTRAEIQSFYLAQYRPDRATLAIAGDVTADRAFAAAQDWFGRWIPKAASSVAPTGAKVPSNSGLRIRLIDTPGTSTTELRIGLAAPPQGSDDETAFSLVSVLFGSAGSSRLAQLAAGGQLRAEARSSYTPLKNAGLFACGVSARNDSVRKVVELLRAELRRFVSEPPGEVEVAAVRRVVHQVFPMRFETLGGLLGYWSVSTLGGISEDEASRYGERVGSLTAAQVADVAGRWLHSERMAVVAVGPAAELKTQLEALGTVEVVSPGQGEEAAAGADSVAAPPTPEQEARGREVVRLAIAAHGGLARLRKIKDSTLEASARINVGDREVEGEIVQVRKDPYRMLFTTSFEGLSTSQTLNGDRGWSSSGEKDTHEMDSVAVAGMRVGFASDLPHLLLASVSPGVRVASRGRERVAEREAEAVEVQSGADDRILYFDMETHHLLGMDQREAGRPGASPVARRLFRDYRPVRGILWPHAEERLLNGVRVMLITVKSVLLDSGVDDGIFERPATPSAPLAR